MSRFFWSVVILGISVLGFTACDSSSGETDDGQIKVVTTLPLFADMIENVGGDRVDVTALLQSGADPHTWEPSPQDAKKVSEADLIFVNGLDLEPAALSLIESNVSSGVRVVRLAEEATRGLELETGDPHVWMNLGNAVRYISVIKENLIETDTAVPDSYSASAASYAAAVGETGEYVNATVSRVQPRSRRLITTHDAFGYLADYIDFEIEAFVAAGPGSEASPDDIAAIVSAVEEQDIPAVFVEPQVNSESETLRQIAEDTGVEICTLYSDSLDDEVTSYIEMMRFNADEIARCLGPSTGSG